MKMCTIILVYILRIFGTLASDLPCAARSGDNDQGYICVCNSTYCDTVGAPVRLSSGSFYHYKTSNSTPGFTSTVANFTNSSATTGTLASDLPCTARSGDNDQGYICVCNSTYCDTVGAPVRLSSSSFYHYKTSNSTPGFTSTVANFTNSSGTTGTLASDLPCAARSGDNDQGYICVCNSTYCDTVGAPVRLSSGSFYHYKTSNSTPGFTSTVAHFTNSSATTGTLASDLPCAARSGDNDQGYICVCNSTYCDTVGAPVRLSSGSFYHYKTSNSTPGFTSTVAHFTNSSATTGTLASDLPCAARSGDNYQGYICVCNSTYCDTVGAPVRLSSGSYYHYKTSNSTPGFTSTVAHFTNSSATTGTLASDLPCAARSGDNDQGYICVCNSTYCDTVGAPMRLSSGSFYHYKTSNSTPGFTSTVAHFTNSSATTGTLASDLPCAARSGDNYQGYICVCNSTYCDTVGAPVRLSSGSYYHYKTSNSTPGFTSTVANFTNSSATTGTLASDLPCAARSGDNDQGYICVCNSTYCDTVGAPVRLSSGSFYHYKTSNATPGFTSTVANFTNSSATTGTLASDLPCAARSGDNDQGYIGVCNSTYCDTVGAPVRLSSGSFYHYKTSNSTPGFTSTVANFTNSSATTGTLASDLPCAARSGDNDQGYIGVCNSTYCDTVGAPVRLSSGSFYHYKTSNSTPGFISTVANFTNSSATTGTLASDLPCAARSGDNDQGYICVCNSTYCDTVGAPVRLSSGSFYHYKTSNSTPGFTSTVANFTNSSATTGTLASDLPCAARSGDNDQGYICVCNSTYCDTVGAPVRLSSSSFYHYKTSNSTPGFTSTVANFTNSSATTGTLASDLPCAARSGDNDQGYICVCNSTYCDTVGAPVRLSSGSFYHYKTSNSTPGFTSTVANFTNSSATTGTLASDLPCAARSGDNDQGYICVCNSTYCDTVGAPVRLSSSSFYHYKTSNSTPGFTSTVANFTNSSVTAGTLASDLPCAARSGDNDQGYICVCNSTYCDTVGAPVRLSSGSFYHYKTSNSTPGFTSTVANFTNSSVTAGTLASDLPCAARSGDNDQGYICVCNSTYCDTVGAPVRLSSGSFYHYKTSNSTPGFTSTVAHFTNSSDVGVNDVVFTINSSTEYQTVIGFGGSITDTAGLVMSYLPQGAQEKFIESYFGQSGIEYSMLRVPIGGSDFSTRSYTLDDVPYDEDLEHFSLSDEDYKIKFADDREAYKALDGIALHWYWDKYVPTSVLDNLHSAYPEKLIISTESSINDGEASVAFGSWERAEKYLYNIFQNVDHWTNAYLDWNLALDVKGGPSLSFEIDAAIIVNQTSGEFYKQPMFYAMGHFSKFVQPESKNVHVSSNQNSTSNNGGAISDKVLIKQMLLSTKLTSAANQWSDLQYYLDQLTTTPFVVKALAFTNPDDSFVVMILNTKNETAHVRIEDPRMGIISISIEKNSINTFVYWP